MNRKTSRPFESLVMPARHDWNSMGPPVPPWFRKQLKLVDPTLVLQFVPPDTLDRNGMNSKYYPSGGWQICRKLPRTGFLHKVVVWSLLDREGYPAPPGPDTIKLLRLARNMWRHHDYLTMEETMDKAMQDAVRAKARNAKEDLMKSMNDCLSVMDTRQFTNRVFIRGNDLKAIVGGA